MPLGSTLALAATLPCLAAMPLAAAADPPQITTVSEAVVADWLAQDGGDSLQPARATIERGRALLKRLQAEGQSPELARLARHLDIREQAVETRLAIGDADEHLRRLGAHGLVRQIAFANPRLRQIKRLLFITRHDARGVFHMVDQFYGFNAQPGGRLLVLEDPFGPEPRLVDLLKDAVVQNGRLQGQRLEGGAFLSPEVSFDGTTILFAWCQAQGEDLEWSERACYHLFKVNADGSDLTQLTDGPYDDFDPCFLPNGRVVFVSTRRGGYLRCGRHCPTYTMFSMAADGSDLRCLSFHETHEWHPSVAHDGRVIYTRWDYVDRDTNIAHHPWECRPDGSDPRAMHGNYPDRRESRPWMEMDLRAIPGSRKFVAVAAAHHGHAFGSLVLFDPAVPDDGAMSPLTRLTPEVPFPEAERNQKPIADCMVYGTPWPLSEDDYLCVYGADAKNRGVYWMDRFGNKELIYRDPAISSHSPIPLQARPKPPVIPDLKLASSDPGEVAPATATVAVMNVYDSDFAWPEGTQITALRIIQVLPKSTAPPNEPRIGVADQTNARAVLGTVPVEPDGSVHFEMPSGIPVYFQALDADGLAVQSMRSATYAQPGRPMTCLGCHEPRNRTAGGLSGQPMALARAPSRIEPELEGANPFNYVRLVQPVLDRKCVGCHEQEQALDLSGTLEGPHHWTRSYQNLAAAYGFYFHVSNGSINQGVHGGSRTIAGAFGARASKLLDYLGPEHYDVELSAEERHRITLWLDCNSEFYGAYENTLAQARGEVVRPGLE
jgi:hypothetical protein